MTQLSELAAYIAADKSEAEALESYLLGSRDIANDLRAAFARLGAERKTGQLSTVADLLGAAQNSRWLTVGHLEDALLIIKGAMTGDYAATGNSLTLRTFRDGSRALLGRHEGTEVALGVSLGYRPRVARLRERLGMPTAPPAEPDTTGDEGLPKREQFTRKLARGSADIHAQVKDTSSAILPVDRSEGHDVDTPSVTAESVAALAIISIAGVDVVIRSTRNLLRRAP
jgi:hypothetical protein